MSAHQMLHIRSFWEVVNIFTLRPCQKVMSHLLSQLGNKNGVNHKGRDYLWEASTQKLGEYCWRLSAANLIKV